jgi:hypothetical protein
VLKIEQEFVSGFLVHNLTINEDHTFAVGADAVLVHNTADCGVVIRNKHLAGKNHPKTGVPFDADGFPDFSAYATHTVKIKQKGNYTSDFSDANAAAGLTSTPRGYSWHHHQDKTTMQLVLTSIHGPTGHTGGVALH